MGIKSCYNCGCVYMYLGCQGVVDCVFLWLQLLLIVTHCLVVVTLIMGRFLLYTRLFKEIKA